MYFEKRKYILQAQLTKLLLRHSPSVIKPSQAMRAADREPAGGAIPVELYFQPLDDFPKPGCRGQIGCNN